MALAGELNIALSQFLNGLLDVEYTDNGELLGMRDSVGTELRALIHPLLDICIVLNQSKCAVCEHTEAAVEPFEGVISRTIKTSQET